MISNPLVSIIIPVYNAAKTLHNSLESLRNQSYETLELLFIDDGSTDDSLGLLEEFEKSLSLSNPRMRVKILKNETNKGVATSRNRGLEEASGMYVYYVDADDWVDREAVSKMVERAVNDDADIVGIDWWLSFDNGARLMKQPDFSTPLEALRFMMTGRMRWNLWLFLVKRSLYVDYGVRFVEGMNMGEDMWMMFRLFSLSQRVGHLEDGLYYYGQSNEESLTKSYTADHRKQVSANLDHLMGHLLDTAYREDALQWMGCLKLNIKLPLLMTGDRADIGIWRTWFPEVNKQFYPRGEMSSRLTVLQWAANYDSAWWLIKLHYVLVTKWYYGFFINSKGR